MNTIKVEITVTIFKIDLLPPSLSNSPAGDGALVPAGALGDGALTADATQNDSLLVQQYVAISSSCALHED